MLSLALDAGGYICRLHVSRFVCACMYMHVRLCVRFDRIRFRGNRHRMKGKMVLWNPGCDHAGIATQVGVA